MIMMMMIANYRIIRDDEMRFESLFCRTKLPVPSDAEEINCRVCLLPSNVSSLDPVPNANRIQEVSVHSKHLYCLLILTNEMKPISRS